MANFCDVNHRNCKRLHTILHVLHNSFFVRLYNMWYSLNGLNYTMEVVDTYLKEKLNMSDDIQEYKYYT